VETQSVIERLVAEAKPVKRLRSPAARTGLWLLVSAPLIALLVWLNGDMRSGLGDMLKGTCAQIEFFATIVTGVTAAYAALVASIPGRSQRILLLPLVPLALWFGAIGYGCWQDWTALGPDGLRIDAGLGCFKELITMGVLPSVVILVMLRRAMPMNRLGVAATAALAASSVSAVAMSLYHNQDTSVHLLVWHMGAILLLVVIAAILGRPIFTK
jgi:hypothetical protein